MKKKILSGILSVVLASTAVSPVFAARNSKIKNIIYMIPDGGGMVPYYLADDVKKAGGWDREVYPLSTDTDDGEMYSKQYLVGGITTYSANSDVTDSAAGGTALSSGYKTKNGYVGIDPDKKPHANLLEMAQLAGKNVGIVATCEWANATPAAFSAHEKDRGNYAPMSEQIVNQGIQVVLGSGFGAAKWGDISEAEIRGYDIIKSQDDLDAVEAGDKLWGDLAPGVLPYDIDYSDEKMPHVADMTKAAITALDEGDDGFFLMVEGSQVDGGGHSNYAAAMVGEFLAFDHACKVALEFAEGRDDTIVVIAPDHDTGGLVLPENTDNTVKALIEGKDPTEISWETTGHTARNGGLFMYIPKGVRYPEGISGKDIGTHKAYENNVIDNTAIAQYLAEIMDVNMDEATRTLFVDVTDMGVYDSNLGLFSFNDYSVSVRPNTSYAYVGNDIADLEGQVTALINNRFYVPQILLDIADGKKKYEICEFADFMTSSMDTYMPDTTDINRWNGRVKVVNFLSEQKLEGEIVFTAPEAFAALDPISISVDGMNAKTYEFECPAFDVHDVGVEFAYNINTNDGKTYSFKSKFKGFAYAGYAGGEVTIDGVIDEAAWDNGIVMTCNDISRIVMIEDWKGEKDLSADFSILWDEEYFYMYAKVTDDIFHPEKLVSNLWSGDSVQFGIYHDTDGSLVNGTAGAKFEEIGIALIDSNPVAYRYISRNENLTAGEIPIGEGFDLACVRDENIITYEVKYKWSELLGYEYTPEIGGVLGFSALINDNDGGGRRGWMEHGSGIGMSKDANQFVMMPLLDFSKKTDDEIKIIVNGEKIESDVAPIIIDNRTFVPVRAIFEAIGAAVEWDGETGTVLSKKDDTVVVMQIGNKNLFVNETTVEIDVPAQIVNDRTLAPVRAVSESFGLTVLWDEQTRTVSVTK